MPQPVRAMLVLATARAQGTGATIKHALDLAGLMNPGCLVPTAKENHE